MRAPSNTYLPLTLAANEVREIIVENVASQLPLYDGSVWLRSIEPLTTLTVTADTILTVVGAGIGFDGTWENRFVDTTLPPEAWLRIQLPVSVTDGGFGRHRITITNPSGVAVQLHALVNGSVEVSVPAPVSTYVVVP